MIERGLYYTTLDFAQMVKNAGGQWNDTKHRSVFGLSGKRYPLIKIL